MLQQDLANLEISAKNFLVKGKPKWKIKPKRFDIFESANIVNNSVKNNVDVIQEKKGPEYCSLWYSRVDCSFFGYFSINNNLHFSFCKEVF
jgi:hypothetical protein